MENLLWHDVPRDRDVDVKWKEDKEAGKEYSSGDLPGSYTG